MGKKTTTKKQKNSLQYGKKLQKNSKCRDEMGQSGRVAKRGIFNVGNSCYISSVFQAISHLNIHSAMPAHSKLFNLLNNLAITSPKAVCPKKAISEISDLWEHQNAQEDAFEFFMTILPLMQSSKFTYEYLCQRFCEVCHYTCEAVAREDCSLMMTLNGKSLQEQINGTVDPIDEICAKCGKGFMMLYKNIMKAPSILAVRIMRFAINQKTGKACKIWNKVALPASVVVGGKNYELEVIILHKSKALNHGHYMAYFYQKKILVDDDKVHYDKVLNLDYSYFYIAFYV